jgi:hypothetical protein
MTTPYAVYRNAGDSGSFFASEQESPSNSSLITAQADPRSPQSDSFKRVSNPIIPTQNAQVYVRNFDPELYDLRDTSHLMRLVRALSGASGIGGIRKQSLIARLTSMLNDGAFLDLDNFYGALFGLERHGIEAFPQNLDGSTINPFTDIANSDIWDEVRSRDARYRSRIVQLAKAVNMGATYPGLKGAAEAVLGCDVSIAESWITADLAANNPNIKLPSANTFSTIKSQTKTFGTINKSYGEMTGTPFGQGIFPTGSRGELIFTPQKVISDEERYQVQRVLNTLKPSNVAVTVATPKVENSSVVQPRVFASDSENWQIQSRVTPAVGLINPATPVYNNTGPYSEARPVFSEYSGEKWSYNPNVSRTTAYQLQGDYQTIRVDEEVIFYRDGNRHTYAAADAVMDTRQAIAQRLSAEGVVTNLPYAPQRGA